MYTYARACCRLTDIVWDSEEEGREVPSYLPSETEVEVDIPSEADDVNENIKGWALDIAADFYGFCIKEASVEIMGKYPCGRG
jgi:hypothetical protein